MADDETTQRQVAQVPELSAFENIKHRSDDGREFWLARELMQLLGYKLWQNFERVINEAIAVVAQEGPEAVASNFVRLENAPVEVSIGLVFIVGVVIMLISC